MAPSAAVCQPSVKDLWPSSPLAMPRKIWAGLTPRGAQVTNAAVISKTPAVMPAENMVRNAGAFRAGIAIGDGALKGR
jgi:hypothetical protein